MLADVGPTLTQHWVNVSYFLENNCIDVIGVVRALCGLYVEIVSKEREIRSDQLNLTIEQTLDFG